MAGAMVRGERSDRKTWLSILSLIVVVFFQVPFSFGQDVSVAHLPGHYYRFIELDSPRPLRIHLMTVELGQYPLQVAVVMGSNPPEQSRDAIRTDPRGLARHPHLLSFINTNPWHPWSPEYPTRVKIIGLGAAGGEVRSLPDSNRVSLWTDHDGRLHMGTPEDLSEVQEGVGGFQQIIRDGEVVVNPGGAVHPRTGLGIDRDGRRLYMVLVEGRQPGISEGVTIGELAVIMQDNFDCQQAANMDGGGSSVMGITDPDGKIRIVDGAPGRYLRPLPILLSIRQRGEMP